MTIRAVKAELKDIQALRTLFLQETNFQIRYNACHERRWTDSYLLTADGVSMGYGAIKGQEIADRDTVFEFYVTPSFRTLASVAFRELLAASRAPLIECQSNDALMFAMQCEFAQNINASVVLFEDHATTSLAIPGAAVRRRRDDDVLFAHGTEPAGDYVVDLSGDLVASGGFLTHYNMPFADLYMEVREDRRRQGFGSFLLQEVKKACYLAGRVPAARCSLQNPASRATLLKAGLRVCGFMLLGTVKDTER